MARGIPIYRLAKTDKPLRASASVLLVRLNELMDWAQAAHDPACVAELHNMRIAAKRLRYTLEIFAPTLGAKAAPLLAISEEIQERIGAIHDCDVLFPLLLTTLEQEMKREKKQAANRKSGGPPPFLAGEGLCALMARKREERERFYREFIAFWDALPPEKMAADFAQLVSETEPSENNGAGEANTDGATPAL